MVLGKALLFENRRGDMQRLGIVGRKKNQPVDHSYLSKLEGILGPSLCWILPNNPHRQWSTGILFFLWETKAMLLLPPVSGRGDGT